MAGGSGREDVVGRGWWVRCHGVRGEWGRRIRGVCGLKAEGEG